jgi:4-carboxymuconolactone decarboxylase
MAASASAQEITITRGGSRPVQAGSAEQFTGTVRVDLLFEANDPSRMVGGSVSFEPGARTAWHTHPLGQVLIVTAGVGRVQRWTGPIDEIRPGDVVRIPPNVKHWHGATDTTSMTHIGLLEHLDGKRVEWMEKVTDAQFQAPVRAAAGMPVATGGPTRAQQVIGDISPKLVELTDQVLYGDVWARPELSPRDRSLVTVAALIATGHRDQLRSHLLRARANGVTQTELVETITHLAFYAGWPSAITAITVAKEVFEQK